MKNIITAFFMAWGNFLTLPCPYKRWNSELKNMMLAFLPSVGAVAGVLWFALGVILLKLGISPILSSLALTVYIYAVCGFMHMDGYMDVNDAILSRRPIEDRVRILKDSTVGAFAVVTLIFLVLGMFASVFEFFISVHHVAGLLPLLVIPIVSRGVAGTCVLSFKPLSVSQYLKDYDKPRGIYINIVAVMVGVLVFIVLLLATLTDARSASLVSVITASLTTAFVTFIACIRARSNLGGMNGDIAGYSICMGELGGMISLALL